MFIVLTFSISIYSQPTPEKKLGAWYMLDANHKVSEAFSIKTGFQLRTFEVFDNMNVLFYYTGINYHLNKKTTLTFAYCYLDIDRTFIISGENHLYENRPYEQISYRHKISNLPIYHRLRLEHRFLNFKRTNSLNNRFRYKLGTKIELNKTFFMNVNNEFFANLEGKVFTENRFYAALGINIFDDDNIQIGYLNHEINKQNLNRIQVGLFFKTDLRKGK
ncbi:DUF2490 domain-containing protein [Litoribaculum gwangyangense]|uniref:DUF2490 domain-containing protein n=2 Tax=Litoribaculum gwangyangense TaxID=1130722 RepID=A0ABP9CEY9_9FLAO